MLKLSGMILLSSFFLAQGRAWGGEFRYLHRSFKGILMGDAYTTLADGPSTLFYNPALAARNQLFSLYPLPVGGETFNLIEKKGILEDLNTDDPTEFVNEAIGTPLFLKASILPTLQFASFTLTPFYSMSGNFIVRDKVHPVLDVNYQYDRGIVFGFGFIPFGHPEKGESLALGFAAKYIKREGIFQQYDIFGPTISNLISSGDLNFSTIRKTFDRRKGSGMGFDVGLDWRHKTPFSVLALGVSVLDTFDTDIKVKSGEGSLPDQEMVVSAGSSFSYKISSLADLTFSLDLHPIIPDMKYSDHIHGGVRLGIPFLDLYMGSNGGLFSYGLTCELYFMELTVGRYRKVVNDQKLDHLLAYMSILDFKF